MKLIIKSSKMKENANEINAIKTFIRIKLKRILIRIEKSVDVFLRQSQMKAYEIP